MYPRNRVSHAARSDGSSFPTAIMQYLQSENAADGYHLHMNSNPGMVLCPYCGEPLALDSAMAGQCQSCHGKVRFAEPLRSPFAHLAGDTDLVPSGLDFEVVAPFIYLAVTTLTLLAGDSVVQQYASAQPEAKHAIRELSRAV